MIDKENFSQQIEQGLSIRQLAALNDCSASSIRYWIKKYQLKLLPTHERPFICDVHGPTLLVKTRSEGNWTRRKCQQCLDERPPSDHYALLDERRKHKQEQFNQYLDEVSPPLCSVCGFNEFREGIDYHHVNPATKSFTITSAARKPGVTLDMFAAEVEKCIPLCARCHRHEEYSETYLTAGIKHCLQHDSCQASSCDECKKMERRWFYQNAKQKVIDALGDECVYCHQSFPQYQYDFHHLDPATKENSVGFFLTQVNYGKIAEEASKCVLLCCNCHRGVETGHYTLPSSLPLVAAEDILYVLQRDTLQKRQRMEQQKQEAETCACGNNKSIGADVCLDCYQQNIPTKIEWPSLATLEAMIAETSFSQVGRHLGVSDTAVRKRLRAMRQQRSV